MRVLGGNTSAIVTTVATATPGERCVCVCRTSVSSANSYVGAVSASRTFANRDKIYVPKEKRGSGRYIYLFYLFPFILGDANARYSTMESGDGKFVLGNLQAPFYRR